MPNIDFEKADWNAADEVKKEIIFRWHIALESLKIAQNNPYHFRQFLNNANLLKICLTPNILNIDRKKELDNISSYLTKLINYLEQDEIKEDELPKLYSLALKYIEKLEIAMKEINVWLPTDVDALAEEEEEEDEEGIYTDL